MQHHHSGTESGNIPIRQLRRERPERDYTTGEGRITERSAATAAAAECAEGLTDSDRLRQHIAPPPAAQPPLLIHTEERRARVMISVDGCHFVEEVDTLSLSLSLCWNWTSVALPIDLGSWQLWTGCNFTSFDRFLHKPPSDDVPCRTYAR